MMTDLCCFLLLFFMVSFDFIDVLVIVNCVKVIFGDFELRGFKFIVF